MISHFQTFTEWKSQVRKRSREGKELTNIERNLIQATGKVAVDGIVNVQEIGIPILDTEADIMDVEGVTIEATTIEDLTNAEDTLKDTAENTEETNTLADLQDETISEAKQKPKKKFFKKKRGNLYCLCSTPYRTIITIIHDQ